METLENNNNCDIKSLTLARNFSKWKQKEKNDNGNIKCLILASSYAKWKH